MASSGGASAGAKKGAGKALGSMAMKALMGKGGAAAKQAAAPAQEKEEEEEDPIVRAEREFFEIIKKEQVSIFTCGEAMGVWNCSCSCSAHIEKFWT